MQEVFRHTEERRVLPRIIYRNAVFLLAMAEKELCPRRIYNSKLEYFIFGHDKYFSVEDACVPQFVTWVHLLK